MLKKIHRDRDEMALKDEITRWTWKERRNEEQCEPRHGVDCTKGSENRKGTSGMVQGCRVVWRYLIGGQKL